MTIADHLDTAAFPVEYAEAAAEILSINDANFLAVKETLYRLRRLSDAEFRDILERMAEGA